MEEQNAAHERVIDDRPQSTTPFEPRDIGIHHVILGGHERQAIVNDTYKDISGETASAHAAESYQMQ